MPRFPLKKRVFLCFPALSRVIPHFSNILSLYIQGRDPDPIRTGVLQREDETEAQYAAFLRQDCAQFNQLMEPVLGRPADVLAYPYGRCSILSEILLAQEGFYTTVTTMPGQNTVIKGLPQTLRSMNRYDLEAMDLTGEELLDLLAGQG